MHLQKGIKKINLINHQSIIGKQTHSFFATHNKSWLNKTLKSDCSVTLPLTSHTTPPLPPLHSSPHGKGWSASCPSKKKSKRRVWHSRRFDPCTLWFEVNPGIPSSTQTQTWLSQVAPSPPLIKNLVDATWNGRYAQLKLTAEMYREGNKITLSGKERLHSDL